MLVTVNVHSSPNLVILIMEVLGSSETLVLARATWRNIPEDGILQWCSFSKDHNPHVYYATILQPNMYV
jgi:hypothetical protein